MPIYRQTQAAEVIYVRVPVDTSISIQAFGSDDGFTTPGTEFGADETIMISGDVVATDGADLSVTGVEVYVNGAYVGSAPLSYDLTMSLNFYQYNLGTLPEGDYNIEVFFRRYRV